MNISEIVNRILGVETHVGVLTERVKAGQEVELHGGGWLTNNADTILEFSESVERFSAIRFYFYHDSGIDDDYKNVYYSDIPVNGFMWHLFDSPESFGNPINNLLDQHDGYVFGLKVSGTSFTGCTMESSNNGTYRQIYLDSVVGII